MTLYEKFTHSCLDTADIGLRQDLKKTPTVFTPLGATVIGWCKNGIDHFCFAPGYGETVFAVHPGASGLVHAVAGSFDQFLSLTAACGGAEVLMDAWAMSRQAFDLTVSKIKRSRKQACILNALKNTFHTDAVTDPYGKLLKAHAGTNYAALRFHEDLREHTDQLPDRRGWAVSYGAGFRDPVGKQHGKPIPVQKQLTWGGDTWHIPTVYSCKEGLVVDILVEIASDRIRKFIDEWQPLEYAHLTPLQEMEIELDNPTELHATISLTLKGKVPPEQHSQREFWNPWDKNNATARRLVEHYGCDREKGWVFLRMAFQWYNKTKAPIHNLKLKLQPLPCAIPGPQLKDLTEGQAVIFAHPVTGNDHTLTVNKITQEGFDYNFLSDIPNCCTVLEYTLDPDLPATEFRLQDTAPSDQPRYSRPEIAGDGAASIGIIGGSDGPVAFFYSPQGKCSGRSAVSSFHYAPAGSITWQTVFHVCNREPASLTLVE